MRYKMDVNNMQNNTVSESNNFPYLHESISVIQKIIQKFFRKVFNYTTQKPAFQRIERKKNFLED